MLLFHLILEHMLKSPVMMVILSSVIKLVKFLFTSAGSPLWFLYTLMESIYSEENLVIWIVSVAMSST